ncbi:hypothetical protein [Streptomyces sp. NPDC093225]|uniref:hypothetical protein n=1 Tax=Streptomyces sp. NPDC093225 TaxID=3366034 RepID=UPI003812AAD8
MPTHDQARTIGRAQVGRREVATALADISRREEHDVAKAWFDADVAQQRTAIARHGTRLESDRAVLSQGLADARAVLAGH